MDLSGTWRAQAADDELRRSGIGLDTDDSDWATIEVPGHWRDHADFADSDGPILYRHRFALSPPELGRRRWVTFDGIFYQGDVWLDGAYLGDPEGYFFPHTFDITALSRLGDEHVLAVEATCSPQDSSRGRHNITGVLQSDDIVGGGWNPGGLWRRAVIFDTGPVRIDRFRVICRDADESRAHVRMHARLDADEPVAVKVRTAVDGLPLDEFEHPVATGTNEVEWSIDIPRPALWWPRSLGEQHLSTVGVEVIVDGELSDQRRRRTGFREVAWSGWVCSINGERLFLKGANLLPTRAGLANATAADIEQDVALAIDAGLDVIRVHGHIADRALYDLADEAGLLILQDFPLQWGYARSVRREAVRQATEAVNVLGHHPSIIQWTAHNDPAATGVGAPDERPGNAVLDVLSQQRPTWNRSVLDRWVKRAFEKADPSRRTVAHSGVLPHLPQLTGTDAHLYFGWLHGEVDELAKLARTVPRTVQFVSELGAQAVPTTAEFLEPERWPDLDWEHLERAHGLRHDIFDERVPPSDHDTFDQWRDATQLYQADVLRRQIETLRRLKYRPTGGFCVFALNDPAPMVSYSVLDHERVPKRGYDALRNACQPIIVVTDPLPPFVNAGDRLALDVHVVNDTRESFEEATVDVTLAWAEDEQRWRFTGDIDGDECVKVGRIDVDVPTTPGTLSLDLSLDLGGDGKPIANHATTEITAPPSPNE